MRAEGFKASCVLVALVVVGCAPVQSTVPELTVGESRYGALWAATAEVMEDYFPILVKRRSEGLIISDYKLGGSLLDPWNQDARQPYYRLEETFHVVRRRAVARLEQAEGEYVLRLQVIKERQAYRPPDLAFTSSYDLYDLTLSERRDLLEEAPPETTPTRPFGRSPAGDLATRRQDQATYRRRGQGVEGVPGPRPLPAREASLTWYRLGDDADLAREMVLAISDRLQAIPEPVRAAAP